MTSYADLPMGLDRTLLRILDYHKGRGMAIGRYALVHQCKQMGFPVHERVIRAQINELRKAGTPICSTGGEDGGYWMAEDWHELLEYIEREIHSRAMDLLEQEKALKLAGEKLWGRWSEERQFKLDF